MWSEDLRPGDTLEEAATSERHVVVSTLRRSGWNISALDESGHRFGRAVFFTHAQIEKRWLMPALDLAPGKVGERAFLLVTTHFDDGRVTHTPWVEGGPCDLDSFEGATFKFLGMVDSRATSLPVEELWVHRDDLVHGTYRFMGIEHDPNIPARNTDPEIEESSPRRTRGRSRYRRR